MDCSNLSSSPTLPHQPGALLASLLHGVRTGVRKRVAVVCPSDTHIIYVVERALAEGIADFSLCLSGESSADLLRAVDGNQDHVELLRCATPDEAARKAVSLVRGGEAQVLMKGTIHTDNLLRAVLDKREGLLREGGVLSHVAVADIPSYPKLLAFSDAAVVPRPTLEQFEAILQYAADVCRHLGASEPKVALIHCTEKTHERFPHTLSYQTIKERALQGRYGALTVDGPMDVKTACDAESGALKGISSPVVGSADALIFPNIESGNTFYKTLTCFSGAVVAGMLCGTVAPVVVTSRADSGEAKYFSLVLSLASLL